MACSRIFNGFSLEITNKIVKELRGDLKSLHSCVLVNRTLCQVAVPMLWEDPFSFRNVEYHCRDFLYTYLIFLDDEDQNKLNELEITIDAPLPFFNYPSFIKKLEIFRMETRVFSWVVNKYFVYPESDSTNYAKQGTAMDGIVNTAKDFIGTSLFKLFGSSEVSLTDLNVLIDSNYGLL